ncbi:MAG: glycosylase [Planctomycetia bacterium]|nr:glycosylase [Planctomycetia bacterium]
MPQSIVSASRRVFLKSAAFTTLAAGLGTSILAQEQKPIPVDLTLEPNVSDEDMTNVYEQVKTPYKYGVIIPQEDGDMVDSPTVFRHNDKWYMIYLRFVGQTGYVARLAQSDDLLHWQKLGTVAPFRETGWDAWQCSPSAALIDHNFGGSYNIEPYDGKYWFTYIGGAGKGYEPDPLKIGLAYTEDPSSPKPWTRLEEPIMTPEDPDAREFEKTTLYKTSVIWDKDQTLGYPFVVFYNGKSVASGASVERIGIAVSNDLIHWRRFGDGPVVDNKVGISGDPQVVKIGDLWVMFYFGHRWKPKAFDTFAVSRDLAHWRKWDGAHLVEPSEEFDKTFAHKPWVVKYDGVVYHYYCAVGDQGRTIALATSKPLK